MKLWHRVVTIFSLMLFCCSLAFSQPAQALDFKTILQGNSPLIAAENTRRNVADDLLGTEFGQKIDVNNSDIRDFRDLRGFYPKLASIIIQNAPYEKVEDVLLIPGLTDTQKERLQANLDRFSAGPTSEVFNEGDERYNPGIY
jgi:photosystem II PsbU protein